jgi:N-glycosylase/DNA lyase
LADPLPFQGTLHPKGRFDLSLTLLCGQCFRWKKSAVPGVLEGVAGGAFWRLRQDGLVMRWECSAGLVKNLKASDWIADYLNLNQDLSDFEQSFQDHPILSQPLRLLGGLRLVRQEPWECAVSYLFAQSLSVKVIQKALDRFCVKFGGEISGTPGAFVFPGPQEVSRLNPGELRPYANNNRARAERIVKLARTLESKVLTLEHLKTLPCDEAREALTGLEGIGPKIADCILLFSLDHGSAFPVDRWVLRALKQYFPRVRFLQAVGLNPTPAQYPRLVKRARDSFGSWCGLASEYLFLYFRLLEDQALRMELGKEWASPLSAAGRSKTKGGLSKKGENL